MFGCSLISTYNAAMVGMRQIRRAASQIAREFRPRRITLFGSYAYGTPTESSDVDLLILMDGRHVHDRAIGIREAIEFGFPVDLLVRSPEEFEQRIDWGDCFLGEIQTKGKVLYEAADKGVGKKSGRRFPHRRARDEGKKVAPTTIAGASTRSSVSRSISKPVFRKPEFRFHIRTIW